MAIKKNLTSTMSSISALQETCNTLEKRLFAKLIALRAAQNSSGEDVTEATFEEFDGDLNELGKVKITAGGSQSAFIMTIKTAVSISRG